MRSKKDYQERNTMNLEEIISKLRELSDAGCTRIVCRDDNWNFLEWEVHQLNDVDACIVVHQEED
jgi:hypothetical protein